MITDDFMLSSFLTLPHMGSLEAELHKMAYYTRSTMLVFHTNQHILRLPTAILRSVIKVGFAGILRN